MKIINKTHRYLSGCVDLFDFDLTKHLSYLNGLPDPANLIERSYLQNKCQNFQKRTFLKFRNNLLAYVAILPVIMFMFLKPRQKTKRAHDKSDNQDLSVLIFSGIDNIVPQSVKSKYRNITEIEFGKCYFLVTSDLYYIVRLLPYIFSPYFFLKCIYKMAIYRAIIEKYKPISIICSSEYSFTSSFLTWYCEQNQIRHINIMHGEKLLNIRDSFFQFHECYIWDTHYSDIFSTLRAEMSQFRISIPDSLRIDSQKYYDNAMQCDYKYYLAIFNEQQIKGIVDVLMKLSAKGKKVMVRPHPKYSDMTLLHKNLPESYIEDPHSVSIESSLVNTKSIIGLYSTVLLQGFMLEKEVILDNLIYEKEYEKLFSLRYILIEKPHRNLSDIITI
jgi:hypothetical protein